MLKKLLSLFLLLAVSASLVLSGCSPSSSQSEIIDGAAMSDAERQAYIMEKLVGDGEILSEESFEIITKDEGDTNSLTDMCLVTSTDEFDLYISFKDTSLCVADKRGDEVVYYHSSPSKNSTVTSIGIMDYFSTLTVEAYDATNKKYEFTTTANCVEDTEYFKIVKMDDDWIRVVYTIGNDADKNLAPPVLRKETFDSIIGKLKSLYEETGDINYKYLRDDVINLYPGFGPEEIKYEDENIVISKLSLENRERYAKNYPIITVRPLFILRDGCTKKQLKLIRSAMEAVGFTVADLKKEMEEVEYAGPSRAVLYTIPLDIKLNDDGVSFEVDASLILGPIKQKLYKICLLPFFGGEDADDKNEYMIAPDGSGSYLAQTGALYATTTRQRIYGMDDTFAETILTEATSPVLSGFFVNNRGSDGGYLAVMDNGAAHAFVRTVNNAKGASRRSCSTGCFEIIYIERDFRTYEKQESESDVTVNENGEIVNDTEAEKTEASGVITSKYRIDVTFSARYIMDEKVNGAEQKTYSDYAAQYRSYLQSKGLFPTEKLDSDSLTFYAELMGAFNKDVVVAGFPVDRLLSLTSYEQVQAIVDELLAGGIDGEDLVVKYTSWCNDGYFNTVADSLRFVKALGTKEQLDTLSSYLQSAGIGFYPDVDFLYVNHDSTYDTYNYSEDSARRLDMSIARVGYRDPVDGFMYRDNKYSNTIVSPSILTKYASSFMEDYSKAMSNKTISLSGFGKSLCSDYRNTAVYTRVASLDEQLKVMKSVTESGYSVMAESGNDYVWKYASYITDVPTGSSEYMSTNYSIPFIQMVLHGYIDYCTEPLNLDADYSTALLVLLETGSGVHFRWMYEDDIFFVNEINSDIFYSLNYRNSLANAIDLYTKAAAILDSAASSEMTNHEKLNANILSSYIGDVEGYPQFKLTPTDGVFMTTYGNGLQVVVNYNDYGIELEDEYRTSVEAHSYIYREGENSEWQR